MVSIKAKTDKKQQLLLQVLICLFVVAVGISITQTNSTVMAQEDGVGVVDVIDDRGSLDKTNNGYKVEINGSIKNSLPIDVFDVEVTIFFLEMTDVPPATTILSQIKGGETSDFEIVATMQNKPSRFVTRVLNYRLAIENVDEIFDEYFWGYEDDSVLRKASISTLQSLSPDSIPQIIKRFQAISSQEDEIADLLEDLLLLPILSESKNLDAAQAVLDKAQLYSSQSYQEAFSKMKSLVGENGTIIELLDQAAEEDKSLMDILDDVLFSIGERSLPILIQSVGGNNEKSELAIRVLKRLNLATPEEQILPFLSIASDGDEEYQAVVETLHTWLPKQNLLLIETLLSTSSTGQEIILELLQEQGNAALPSINEVLKQNNVTVSPDITLDEALNLLTELYRQKRLEHAESLYTEGIAYFETGDCTHSSQLFDQFLEITEYRPNQDVIPIVKAYNCSGNYQQTKTVLDNYLSASPENDVVIQLFVETLTQEAEQIEQADGFEKVIKFWQEAMATYPSLPLRQELGDLYLSQGYEAKNNKEWNKAIAYFEQAEQYLPNPAVARLEIGKIIARKQWLVLLIGVGITIFASIMVVEQQKSILSKG